ncbi:MAG: hypothetical protein SF097_23690 [Acidobacteriota bacterium]|nr:hypothetical protein [Acidobacteriota bacterium]
MAVSFSLSTLRASRSGLPPISFSVFSIFQLKQVIRWFYQAKWAQYAVGFNTRQEITDLDKIFSAIFLSHLLGSIFFAKSVTMRAADRKSRKTRHSIFQLKEIPD